MNELPLLLQKAKNSPNERQIITIGKVNDKLNKEALKHNFDLNDYEHNIDVSGARHVFKEHGSAKTETPRGQKPIIDADFKKIPHILYFYDDISFTGKNKIGCETITYRKKFPDGTIYYVEEIRTGKKTLTINTMYKR